MFFSMKNQLCNRAIIVLTSLLLLYFLAAVLHMPMSKMSKEYFTEQILPDYKRVQNIVVHRLEGHSW